MRKCETCAVPLPPPHKRGGRPRQWCPACSLERNRRRVRQAHVEADYSFRSPTWRASMLSNAMHRAQRRGAKFDRAALEELLDNAPDRCPVFGTLFAVRRGVRGVVDTAPTVDRLDNSKGYVRGNMCLISWKANRVKNDATLSDLTAVVTWLRSHDATK